MVRFSEWASRFAAAGAMVLVAATTRCDSSSKSNTFATTGGLPPPPPQSSLYQRCSSGCGTGTCVSLTQKYQPGSFPDEFCTQPCEAGCENGVCGVGPDGKSTCFPRCEGLNAVCVDQVPTACAATKDDKRCDICGCPGTLRCEPGVGCTPKVEVGAPCASDDDCKTANCSELFKICRAPVGAACTTSNCDLCITNDTGYSFCSRECSISDCGSELCLGNRATGFFYCHQNCAGRPTSACPGLCTRAADAYVEYCDCSSCKLQSPLRTTGLPCHYDSECVDGACLRPNGCTTEDCGYCSRSCSTAADCGSGVECIDLPCSGPPDAYCGKKCLPACSSQSGAKPPVLCAFGTCRSMPASSGASVEACDVRVGELGSCTSTNQCLQGACTNSRCIPTAGLSNGSPCAANGECQSMNCRLSVCKGSALIGDKCSVNDDCQVGSCCTIGPNKGLCATSC